jgi:hypothetical protein
MWKRPVSIILTANVSRSLDLAGNIWGLRKRHKDRHRASWAQVGLTVLMRDACDPPPPPSAFIYTACMGKWDEMQVEFSWVWSSRRQEQSSCGVLLFTTDYPVSQCQVSVSCFSCKAALLNLVSPWLGPCLSAKRPLTEPCSCQGLVPLAQSPLLNVSFAEPCSLPSFLGLAFSAQRTLTWAWPCQGFFSVYLVPGLPHIIFRNQLGGRDRRIVVWGQLR